METKLSVDEWGRMKVRVGFTNCFPVGSEGRRGGLALLWNNSLNVSIDSNSPSHIDAYICRDDGVKWRFTGFYGQWDSGRRQESWDLLSRLGSLNSLPWLCGGDFNEILFHHEKIGGNRKPEYLLTNFRNALDVCNLGDCGYEGYKFTWANNFESGFIEERIDRFVANPNWKRIFPLAKIKNVEALKSDHLPIVMEWEAKRKGKRRCGRTKHFRFEAMWREEGCGKIVQEEWGGCFGNSKSEMVTGRIAECSLKLQKWNETEFGDVGREISHLRKLITKLGWVKDKSGNRNLLRISKERVEELLQRQEILWRQRSRMIWLAMATRTRNSSILLLQKEGKSTPLLASKIQLGLGLRRTRKFTRWPSSTLKASSAHQFRTELMKWYKLLKGV